MNNWMEIEREFEFDVYPKRDICLVKGEGAVVEDSNGRKYIDCVAGHGVANIGHCNEYVVEAIKNQVENLITCSNVFYNNKRAEFLEKLVSIAPESLKRVFLCNSGAESIEAAIKFARFTTKKTEIITAMKGFHGRTYGAMSATFTKKYRESFEPIVPGFVYTPFNKFEKLLEKVNENTAAIILETVQGEGGVNLGDPDFFQSVRTICDEKNILLIIDEVQTGFGRTGKMFGTEHMGVEPDIMTVAKAIAGGLPMGAVLCNEKIEIPVGMHGTTFGGNPLVCAAGIATLDYILGNKLEKQSEELGNYFMNSLKSIKSDKIKEVRGLGLMIGVELTEKVQTYILKLMELGILALPAGSKTLRFLPPLIITKGQIDEVVNAVEKVI